MSFEYVLQRVDGYYVALRGKERSYTLRLAEAWRFTSRGAAQAHARPDEFAQAIIPPLTPSS